MTPAPTQYFDRYQRILKDEPVYGEKWLRRAYDNPVGRFAVWLLVRRKVFSWWYGQRMRSSKSESLILPFIEKYEISYYEFAKSPFLYKSFNEFFSRALKPDARPIAADGDAAVFPADGRHLGFSDLDAADGFYVKGARFTLAELLGEDGDPEDARPLTRKFAGGAMMISRLCPIDYHRFHFPVSGVPGETRSIEGWLYSVHPIALRRNIRYLVRNRREVTTIESPEFGSVAMIEVGATNVGSIHQGHVPGREVGKGDEKGFFAFGGSCVITLYERGRIRFDRDLVEQTGRHVELFAKVGDQCGKATR